MTVILDTSRDLTLESLHQITRDGASCALSEAALDRVARRREEFLAFVRHNEDRLLYGITTKHHVGAKTLLDAESRAEFARRLPPTPAGFGEPLRRAGQVPGHDEDDLRLGPRLDQEASRVLRRRTGRRIPQWIA